MQTNRTNNKALKLSLGKGHTSIFRKKRQNRRLGRRGSANWRISLLEKIILRWTTVIVINFRVIFAVKTAKINPRENFPETKREFAKINPAKINHNKVIKMRTLLYLIVGGVNK